MKREKKNPPWGIFAEISVHMNKIIDSESLALFPTGEMMQVLKDLFDRNREWAEEIKAEDPEFFSKLSNQQAPEYLWIGCSDSRVPANQIVNLLPGEVFVHRNIANLVIHTDLNCLSVIQYAVEVLKIKHVIICGHYDCGGVKAAMEPYEHGLIDNWLSHIRDTHRIYKSQINGLKTKKEQLDRMCELNVIEQVNNICQTTVVQNAWKEKQDLTIHGWIYGIEDGILQDLNVCITGPDDISKLDDF